MKSRIISIVCIAAFIVGCSDDDSKANSPSHEVSTDVLVPIPDNDPNGVESALSIWAEGVISDPAKVNISFTLSHTFAGDLIVMLEAPDGSRIPLVKRLGVTNGTGYGISADFIEQHLITFNAASETPLPTSGLATTDAIVAGIYLPTGENSAIPSTISMGDLSQFLMGKSIVGTWKLVISDYSADDDGSLINWKLKFEEGALN